MKSGGSAACASQVGKRADTIETKLAVPEKRVKQETANQIVMDNVASDVLPETDSATVVLLDALESLDEGIAVFGPDHRLVVHNRRYAEMMAPIAEFLEPGLEWKRLLEHCLENDVYIEARGRHGDYLKAALAVPLDKPYDTVVTQSDGAIYRSRFNPTSLGGFVVSRTDITEQVNAERMADERENLLKTVLDTIPTAVTMSDLETSEIIYKSSAADSLYGDTTPGTQHHAALESRDRFIQKLVKKGRLDGYQFTLLGADGQELPCETTARLTEYNGKTYVVSAVTDLTEQIKKDELIRLVVEACPAPILMTEVDTGNIIFRSPELEALFGTGENTRDYYANPGDRDAFIEAIRASGATSEHRSRFFNADGKEFWGAVSARLIQYEGKDVIVSFSRDMTDQLESEALIRHVLEACPTPLRMTKADTGEILFASPETVALFGPADTTGTFYADPTERTRIVELLREHGVIREYMTRYVDARGNEFMGAVSARLIRYNGEDVVVSHVRDMTDQLESEALMRRVIESCPIPLLLTKAESGEVLVKTPESESLFGRVDKSVDFYVDPVERQAYLEVLREKGFVKEHKLGFVTKSGRRFWGAVSSRLIQYQGEDAIVSHTRDMTDQLESEALIRNVLESCPTPLLMTKVETGEILFRSPEIKALFGSAESSKEFFADPADRDEYLKVLRKKLLVSEYKVRFRAADGHTFWSAMSARLIKYQGEDVIVSHIRDITEQLSIEEELARQQEQLFQNEKMSALGGLLAGVAHELNNPLSVVVGHALMLREESQDAETIRQTRKISDAAERCAKIVKTFLTMARQEPSRMEQTDVNGIVATAVDVARYGDGASSVRIDTKLAQNLENVCADADQLTQVIINLLINAEQAMLQSGVGDRVTVRTRNLGRGRGIEICVEDNGPGIPKDIQARIFEPFFTTKDVGEGTGIGLAICHRIVHSHNGSIRFDTSRDGGTAFTVTLPPNAPSKADEGQSGPPASQAAGPARVLVIDDEEDVAALNGEMLKRGGYDVSVTNSALDALAAMEAQKFDAIVSDLNMPVMDGRGFFEAVSERFPDQLNRTGFLTGDTMGMSSQAFLKESERPYLEKPVSPKELRDFVAKILSEGAE